MDPTPLPSSRRTTLARTLLVILLLALPAAPAQGQPASPGAVAEAEPAPPPEPQVIAVADVSTAAAETEELLRSIETLLAPRPEVEAIAERREAALADLAEAAEELEALLATRPGRARLDDAESAWAARSRSLQSTRQVLAARVAELELFAQDLETRQELWTRTRAEAVEAGAPEAVRERIANTLASVRSTSRKVRARSAAVLTIQEWLARAEVSITRAEERIGDAQREFRSRLLERDALPLWRWTELSAEGDSHLDDVRTSVLHDVETLREYARRNVPSLLLAITAFCVFLYYGLALRRGVLDSTEDDPALAASATLFERPVSLALLPTVTGFALIPQQLPNAVRDLDVLLLLIPLLRLVPPLVPQTFRAPLYGTAVFFTLSQLRTTLDQAPLVSQLSFLLQLLGAIALLLWLMRPQRLATLEPDQHVSPTLGRVMRVATIVLSIALLSTVFGYQAFGRVLGDGMLGSAYVGVLLYGAMRSVEAVLRVTLHTERARSFGIVRRRSPAILRWTLLALQLGALLIWLDRTLNLFAIRGWALERVDGLLAVSLTLGALAISVGDVLAFALTLFAAWVFARVVRFFLEEEVLTRVSLRRGIANAVSTLLHYTLLTLGLLLALGAAGMDFSRVTLLAGAFGVGIGFGLQNVVNNFVSGLILLFERPIQTGDTVEVGGMLGDVRRIGIRSSTVRTFDGAEVLVPNANLVSDQVVNWTLSDRLRRIEVDVGVAYGTDARRVLDLLLEVAAANEGVLRDPQPQALFLGFGDSSLDFRLRAWIPRFDDGMWIKSELAVGVQAALRDAEIEVPFPQRDLHLRSVLDGGASRVLWGREDEGGS